MHFNMYFLLALAFPLAFTAYGIVAFTQDLTHFLEKAAEKQWGNPTWIKKG